MNRLLPLLCLTLMVLTGCQTTPTQQVPRLSEAGQLEILISDRIRQNRLTWPSGQSALSAVEQLARIQPNNPAIARYRVQITQKLIALGQRAVLHKEYDKATRLARRALQLDARAETARYILVAVEEAKKETRAHFPSETVEIEQVEAAAGVSIMSVDVPEISPVTSP